MKKLATSVIIILVLLIMQPGYTQPGSLDNTFGIGGVVTTDFGAGSGYDRGYSVAIQSDGKIVVAGTSKTGIQYDFALVRYNFDGSLDNTFDLDGKVTTAISPSIDIGLSVAIQSDGKIVLAGYSSNGGNYDFAIARYKSDGSLDSTFDSDGIVTTEFGSNYDYGNSVAIQPDGKIVVAGRSSNTDINFAVARYNIDGSLDNTFGFGGKITSDFGSGYDDTGYSVAIQSDGKIVVAGNSDNGLNALFAVVRYNTDGGLDNTFDLDAKATTDFGSGSENAVSVDIQSDGKILLAGWSYNGSNEDFAIVRYNNDGSLDNSFDLDGMVTTAIGPANDAGSAVVIQSDGKIVVAGYSDSGINYDFAVVQYNSDGSLDNTFDIDGKVTTDFGSDHDWGYSVAIQSDGKMVVAGWSSIGTYNDFAAARYNSTISTIIENSFIEQPISIFPNPFNSQTTLQSDYPLHNATLIIENYLGQSVAQIKNISGQTIIFNRDNLPSGLYFVRLTEGNKIIAAGKLVITDK